jgi:hypothetical protein
MRSTPESKPQWRLGVIVYHGPNFGHKLMLETQRQGFDTIETSIGSWKGLGIPDAVLNHARAILDSCFTDHLVSRYGVANQLWDPRMEGPEPF